MEIKGDEYNQAFDNLTKKMADVFKSEAGIKNMQNYLRGLLGTVERKNGWQMSEYLGETTPYTLQQFLYRGAYNADELRDRLITYTSENIGETEGHLIIDETGFLKQGKCSCGVKRQYSGTAGRVENCQIGVFLTYAGTKGHNPIDRRLYMPQEWIDDTERREKAGVPEELTFQTKPQMALEMIQDATDSGIPYTWVSGDCVYGDYSAIREWLESKGKCYVMSVSGKAYVWQGNSQKSIGSILMSLPEEGWFEASCGDGSKGERLYDWLMIPINPGSLAGYKRTLLIRRSKSAPDELRAYICFAPEDTLKEKYAEVAGTRWTIETCFKESKSEVGLDQYEVRSYDGWYKHITLACIALAFLTVLSSQSLDTKSIQEHNPGSTSLEAFKKGRNLRV
ncbi:MAG: IS701 family transposase [Chitinispirillales bacterium]|jgi:SRSO17 transposase|nr:IS701 family transposase [Chitinispirillales bacterium]